MNINNVLKRQTIIITVTIIGICLTLVAISYAIFFNVKEGTTQIVESGDLVIQFTNDKLLEDELFPISDTKVQDMKGYNFSVTNKGSLPMRYKIYIYDKEGIEESLKTKMLSHEYIKVQLDNYPIKKLSELTNEEGKLLLKDNLDVKAKGTSGDVRTHTIKVWIDEEAPEETIGNIIALDIEVEGVVGEAIPPIPNLLDVCNNNEQLNTCLAKASNLGNLVYDGASRTLEDGSEQLDNNLRYIGQDPNNYVWFNCNDYTKVTDKTTAVTQQCEKWRIIGLFKDITKGDDTKENLVKIVRAESIGDIAWDSADTNDWTTASLQKTLNGTDTSGYLNPSYNKDGVKGITANTNNMIETVVWNLGGTPNYDTEKAEGFYKAERGSTTYNNSRPTIWKSKIGLIYPSDYGYATSGSNEEEGTNRETCLKEALYNWDSGAYQTDCAENDYLKRSSGYFWTLAPSSSFSDYVFTVRSLGYVNYNYAYYAYAVRPSLYLKSGVKIVNDGESDGSKDKPYILTPPSSVPVHKEDVT